MILFLIYIFCFLLITLIKIWKTLWGKLRVLGLCDLEQVTTFFWASVFSSLNQPNMTPSSNHPGLFGWQQRKVRNIDPQPDYTLWNLAWCFLAMYPWAYYLFSLCLSFLIWKWDCLMVWFWGLHDIIHVNCWEQCLAHRKCLTNVSYYFIWQRVMSYATALSWDLNDESSNGEHQPSR